ncbi:MAG: UDP-N-acetylmuramoyl-L-alanine--D-glutamate ligase [Chloroflexi bacterium]|nr:UDP-N-acetylmuramoyl-L-alanine--D-glutamate ligase [Chloroflexota bacterium]
MDWKGKRVLAIGIARQGIALASYLSKHGAQVVLNDQRPAEAFKEEQNALAEANAEWVFSGHPLSVLDGVDMVFPSGGVPLNLPLVTEALKKGIPLSNDSQVFLEAAPCKVVGITGSAGKTTTTSLVGRIGQAVVDAHSQNSFPKVWVGGNIGLPLIAHVDEMHPDDLAILELSSFQLDLMTKSPDVAAILNITPNHLDRHRTMQAYTHAKARILEYQSNDDVTVLGREDSGAWDLAHKVSGRLLSFGKSELNKGQLGTFVRGDSVWLKDESAETKVIPINKINLLGEHNLLNVLAACAIAAAVNLPLDAMREGIEAFTGIPHRLEFVRLRDGVQWYNDSIATAPERTIAAIKSFDSALVLLAGGRDKDLPWEDFAAQVRKRVDHLIVFGEAVDIILGAVGEVSPIERPYTITACEGLKQAVQTAAEISETGDVVLLAPGGTSFDEFYDFEERGEKFKEWVMKL